jgi:hypothetical protein
MRTGATGFRTQINVIGTRATWACSNRPLRHLCHSGVPQSMKTRRKPEGQIIV